MIPRNLPLSYEVDASLSVCLGVDCSTSEEIKTSKLSHIDNNARHEKCV